MVGVEWTFAVLLVAYLFFCAWKMATGHEHETMLF